MGEARKRIRLARMKRARPEADHHLYLELMVGGALALVGCTRCGAALPQGRAHGERPASLTGMPSARMGGTPLSRATSPSQNARPHGGGAACRGLLSSVVTPLDAGAAVAIQVEVTSDGCTVAPDFVGSNFEPFVDWGADVSMSAFQATAFAEAGLQLLRYPGGAPGDWQDLLMTGRCGKGELPNYGAPTYLALWDFAKKAGVNTLMLQTNPTPQWCGRGSQDSSGARAAAIARDAVNHGVNTVFEVGNEPDMPGGYFAKNGGQSAYTSKFVEHATAIHAAVPGSEVFGPALCGLGANCAFPATWDSGYLAAFLSRTGDRAPGPGNGSVDGVSLHVYWHNEWAFSDLKEAKMDKYGFGLYWANTLMPHVREVIRKHDTRDLPISVSEISVGNGIANDAGQAQNMFSVLATLDTIGAFAASGVRSFQWFDANAAGPADFWLITPERARPLFYAFVAWAKMGTTVLELTSNQNLHDVAAYATKKADGSVQVLLINKTATEHAVTVGLHGWNPHGKRLEITSLSPATPGVDTAKSVLYNGAVDPPPGRLPAAPEAVVDGTSLQQSLAPYSAAVLTVGP